MLLVTCISLLAAKSISGEYFLRGHLHTESTGFVTMGGAEFHYVRHESGMETLTATGPLIEPVVIEVCLCVVFKVAQISRKCDYLQSM